MSDKRKVLVAKRKNERNPKIFSESRIVQEDNHFKHGTKRPINNSPKKNLANDRLKRLRTSLTEEVAKSTQSLPKSKDKNCVRKRPNNSVQHEVSTKLFIKESASSSGECSNRVPRTPFVFKEQFLTQTNVFTTVSPNPFAVGFKQTAADKAEDMEWCPTDDEVSKSTSDNTLNSQNTSSCDFYIVVDTNVFLSQLNIITSIVTMSVKGPREPVIFIPWIVTEELDFIKGDSNKRSLRQKAQDAIKFIEKTLSSKHHRMKGQTLMEANEQQSVGANQDNKIIACCIQVLEKYENMTLLTNDINLKNKAHFNKIPVCSSQEIMLKIQKMQNNTSLSQEIMPKTQNKAATVLNIMTSLCNTVIRECAKNAYGEACSKMPICQPPSKTLTECIATFTKYWFPVFQEVIMKQFKNAIEDLSAFLSQHTTINDTGKELNDLMRLCLRVCLFLKDVECCKNMTENTIRDLNSLKNS